MEWYEIIGLVVAWVAGVWLRGEVYAKKNGYTRGNSRKKKGRY